MEMPELKRLSVASVASESAKRTEHGVARQQHRIRQIGAHGDGTHDASKIAELGIAVRNAGFDRSRDGRQFVHWSGLWCCR